MPEPTEAGQGAQTGQIASTPQTADQPTTVTQNDQQLQGLMDHLDIPPELQSRIAATTNTSPEPPATTPVAEPPEPETEPEPEQAQGKPPEEEGDEDDDEPPEGQRPDKRQKRINRLTRQKAELEQELTRYRETVGKATAVPQPVPSANTRLAHISDEVTLNQEITKATGIMEWCDANAEGVATEGPDGTEKYHTPEQVNKWRREAEKVVLDAPQRRDEIRLFSVARTQYDQIAQQVWPELFDKSTPEHQAAAQLLAQYPNIRATPQANYAAGLVIEGVRSLMARLQANGQQPAKQHRDIDERAFNTPRMPIAPHSPEPPSRELKPSSQKRVNQAMEQLTKDPDGSSEALANAFAAMDAAKATRSNSRSPVKV